MGNDAAGKTTILYRLKLGEYLETVPSSGFNVEAVTNRQGDMVFDMWDIRGGRYIRPMWRHYYPGTRAVIYVFYSFNAEWFDDSRAGLQLQLAAEELRVIPLLVFANKQDMPGAITVPEVTERLGLGVVADRQWHVQPSCATSGDGVYEGIDWLSVALRSA